MSQGIQDPESEITVSEILRDRIFEHLPPQAKFVSDGVAVKFWPNNHGEMELKLAYSPADHLLDIDAEEGIYGPDERLTGKHIRGCELDSVTGRIIVYVEYMETGTDEREPFDKKMVDAERDLLRFNENKLIFFLKLFESL